MLQKYIQDLLYRYDLVIIPGFGGIVSRKKSAKYNRKTHLFSPPYKDLSFNASLLESDGLLINYVASILETNHKKAEEFIKEQVDSWKEELEKNKRLVIENIGIFSLIDHRIIFQALLTKNYLTDSYGLNSFKRLPINREFENNQESSININPKKQNKVEDYFFENQTEEKKSPKLIKYAAIAVIGLALIGGGAYYFISGNTHDDENFQKASYVVKKDMPAVEVDSTGDTTNVDNTDAQNSETTNNTSSQEETSGTADNQTSDSGVSNNENSVENKNSENNTNTQPEASKSPNTSELSGMKYQLIVGAFKEEANAMKKTEELKSQGYHAAITGQNKGGLYMVAIDGADNFNDAKAKLDNLKSSYPDLWIYIAQ